MSQQFADISGWQVADPRLDGMDGVMIKTTEGTTYINPNFPSQLAEAQSLNKEIGMYHFASLEDMITQAQFYVANSQRVEGEAQALDIEAKFFTLPDPVGSALEWLIEVERLSNNKPGMYLQFSELQALDWSRVVANGNWLWIAEWNGQNQPQITQFPVWTMWQYADTNISGGDSDIFNGDVNTFKAIAKNSVNPTTPVSPAPVQSNTPNEGNNVTEIPAQQLDEIHQFDNQVIDTVVAEVRANTKVIEDMITSIGGTLGSINTTLTAINNHFSTPTPAPTVNLDVDALATAIAAHIAIDPAAMATAIASHLQNTNIDALAAAFVKAIGVKLSA